MRPLDVTANLAYVCFIPEPEYHGMAGPALSRTLEIPEMKKQRFLLQVYISEVKWNIVYYLWICGCKQ